MNSADPDKSASNTNPDPPRPPAGAVFATTQWTRVLAARGDSPEARSALSDLCETYYQPVVTFLRSSGRRNDLARDLAHEFFSRLLRRHGLDKVERGRARFRSYLLGALKHFLADRHDRESAEKRGGHREHLPLGSGTDTSPGVNPADDRVRTPEEEFDRQWALTVLDKALAALATEHETAGKEQQFQLLKGWLTGDAEGMSQAEAARELHMNEGAVKVAIHRLRKRFRQLVKSQIAQTVSEPAQVEEELQNLIAALG